MMQLQTQICLAPGHSLLPGSTACVPGASLGDHGFAGRQGGYPHVCGSARHRRGAGECCMNGPISIFSGKGWFPGTWSGTDWLVFLSQFKFAKSPSAPLPPRPCFPRKRRIQPKDSLRVAWKKEAE